MGRYWNTDSGICRKFGVALQDSDDPEIFGMEEDTSILHYYMSDSDIAKCEDALKRLYDHLEIPEEERAWTLEGDNIDKALEDLQEKYWKYTFEDNDTSKTQDEYKYLSWLRVALGIAILSDLKHDGYCELEAEC